MRNSDTGQRIRHDAQRLTPLLALWLFALVPPAAASVMALGRDDGLPSQQMHAITQGGDGRIYMAGPSGLTVYDGQRTSVLGTGQGLSTHGLRAVATRSNGLLAVGGDAGLDLQLADGSFRPLVEDGWSWGFVEDILAHPDGSLWIAASRGLVRWDPESAAQAVDTPLIGINLVQVVTLADGRIWTAGPGIGLLRRDHSGWRQPASDDWRAVGDIAALAPTARGTLLVGGEFGLLEVDAEGTVLARYVDEHGGPSVTALAVVDDETWAGTGSELVRLRRTESGFVVDRRASRDTLVNDLYVDAIDSVWAATDNRGTLRISALRDEVVQPEAPCAAAVMSVRADAAGRILAGGDLCSWLQDGNAHETLPALDGTKTWDLMAHDGSYWAATDAGLMELTAATALTRHGGDLDLLNAPGRALAVVAGSLWVGTVRGLARREADGAWRPVPTANDEATGYVYTIETAHDGSAWVGTIGQGLWRWDGRVLGRAAIDGLPERGNAYAVATAADGRIAVSLDDRIYLLENGGARALPRVRDDSVAGWSLEFADEALWVGSSSGLLKLDAASGELQNRYTAGLGMAAEEFTTSRSLLSRDGKVYAATARGLTVIDPAAVLARVTVPQVALAGISWRNAKLAAEGAVRYGNWSADVHFYAPWYFDERSLRFRYRLSGFDDDWVDAESLPVAHYTALPAGRYTLLAQAGAPLLGWGPEETVWSLTVRPPWWQHPLALLAYTILPLLLIVAGTQWRTQVIRSRNRKLQRAVDERTAELAKANVELARLNDQKDRMVSVVAHDLRTPLAVADMYASLLEDESAAQRGVRSKEAGKAIRAIHRVATQGMNVIDSMLSLQSIEAGRAQLEPEDVDMLRLLRDEVSTIGELAAARRNIGVRLQTTESSATVQCDPARVLQVISNLLNNALKYSEPDSEVVVHLHRQEDGVTVAVQDFGTGIAPDELERIFKPYTRSSTAPVEKQVGLGIGLTICRLLIEQHGGRISIESTPGEGTTVSFFLPWRCAGQATQARARGF